MQRHRFDVARIDSAVPAGLGNAERLQIVADLVALDRPPIGLVENGSLAHLDQICTRSHDLDPIVLEAVAALPQLSEEYEVEVVYQVPPARPVVRALAPTITIHNFPADIVFTWTPHLVVYMHALCVAYGPDEDWTLEQRGARRYADAAAFWLARHTLWGYLQKRLGPAAAWLGPYAPHDPAVLVKTPPDGPCHCGSGRTYRACPRGCPKRDAENLAATTRLLQRYLNGPLPPARCSECSTRG